MAKYTGMMLGLCENYVKIGNLHRKNLISYLVGIQSYNKRGFFLKFHQFI